MGNMKNLNRILKEVSKVINKMNPS
jgi:hypothetical protein